MKESLITENQLISSHIKELGALIEKDKQTFEDKQKELDYMKDIYKNQSDDF